MAQKPLKASKTNLVCKIVNIEKDPKLKNRMIVAVQIDDGSKAGPWIHGFSLLADKPMSISDFMAALYTRDLSRPVDPYAELKRWKKSGKRFELKLTPKVE